MLSLKRFGPAISNNFYKYKHYPVCVHTQTHLLKCRNQKAALSAKKKNTYTFIARSSLSDHRYLKDRVVFGYYLVPKGL